MARAGTAARSCAARDPAARRRGIARGASPRDGPRRRHQQHAGDVRARWRAATSGRVVFYEVIRFNRRRPPRRSWTMPCGASARSTPTDRVRPAWPLTRRIPCRRQSCLGPAIGPSSRDGRSPCSVHLSESREEVEFIGSGSGPWRTLLEEIGSWDPVVAAAGGAVPVEYLDRTRLPRRPRCSPFTASRCRRPTSRGWRARHDAGDVPAQQRAHRCGIAAVAGVLRVAASRWRSAPTASPARRI